MRNKTRASLPQKLPQEGEFHERLFHLSRYLIGVLVADSNLTQSHLLSSALRRKRNVQRMDSQIPGANSD